jgi:conjugal transfer pilus assembly protein TraK
MNMKKQFLVSLLSLAVLPAFAQSTPVIDETAAPPAVVVVPKAGTIAIPAPKAPGAIKIKSDLSGGAFAAPGAINLPVPKPQRAEAQNLPGLGVSPGVIADNKIKSVKVGSDRNELVYVSLTQLNKIATPFADPKIVDSTGATLKAVGQDLFIQPANDKPLTVYITDGGVGQSIGITLVPVANLPAQSIVIEPDASTTKNVPSQPAQDELVPSDYVGRLTSHIKQLALGKTPTGFVKSKLTKAIASSPQLVYETQNKFVGSTYDIFSYKLVSVSESPIELSEETFYTPSVRAVAFYPLAMLQKGEATMVYVIAEHMGAPK